MQAIADQILAAVRDGAHINPGPYVHAQLVNEMGGEWEAMKADLDTAKEKFAW
jgi:hypothetical protein